ncbi:hypothetical protein BC360_09910 [Ensifer sp. LC163]|nr:hypothetical protein BC360_09910 [Ensifer sp. LC163]
MTMTAVALAAGLFSAPAHAADDFDLDALIAAAKKEKPINVYDSTGKIVEMDVAAATLILKNADGRYGPLTLGKVPADAPDFMCPGYIATGAGGNYPTLQRVVRAISATRIAVSAS